MARGVIAASLGAALMLAAGCRGVDGPSAQTAGSPGAVADPTALHALRPIDIGPRDADPKRALLRDRVLVDGDFRETDLRGADLSGLDLHGANFTGADLTRANFSGAQLAGAVFTNADLRGADFEDAAMQDAVLNGWNLDLANFDGVAFARNRLPKDLFRGRRLIGNVFDSVDLSGADFSRSMLIDSTRVLTGWSISSPASLMKL